MCMAPLCMFVEVVYISLQIMAVTNMTQSLCHQCSIEGEMNLGMHIEAHYVNDVLFFV